MRVVIVSRDRELLLALHLTTANALPNADVSAVTDMSEMIAALARAGPATIVFDCRLVEDPVELSRTLAGQDPPRRIVVIGDEARQADRWPGSVCVVSRRAGVRAVVAALLRTATGADSE